LRLSHADAGGGLQFSKALRPEASVEFFSTRVACRVFTVNQKAELFQQCLVRIWLIGVKHKKAKIRPRRAQPRDVLFQTIGQTAERGRPRYLSDSKIFSAAARGFSAA
jgi:hypothetical protein